jgi:hypothetical protein
MNIEELFMTKVIVRPDGCWEWIGSFTSMGYGLFVCEPIGIRCLAHRFIYSLHKRALINSKIVLRHNCDNPWCVNPDHVIEGSKADNARDASERGRAGPRKLSDHQIQQIYENTYELDRKTLSKLMGVTTNQIGMIQRGQAHQSIVSKRKSKRKRVKHKKISYQ